jgi:hypothetical protein
VAVGNENSGVALESAIEARRTKEDADNDPVDGEQTESTDDAAGHGVVVADDRVLDGIRQRKKDDEVEGIQLCEFALAEEAQEQNQNEVHDDRTQQFFDKRDRQMKHAIQDRCEDHASEDNAGYCLARSILGAMHYGH